MNIAVIIGEDIEVGGGFQYAFRTVQVLNKYRSQDYNFVFFTLRAKNLELLAAHGIEAYHLKISNVGKALCYIRTAPLMFRALNKIIRLPPTSFDRIMSQYRIDLVFPVSISELPLLTERYNYLFMLMDLCHRDFMEFPEVNQEREFEIREALFRKALPKAVAIITESELGRQNAIRRYGLDSERVVALPMLPQTAVNISTVEYNAGFVDIKKKYGLGGEYIYYPAQFWPHKNHIYILEGLKILKEQHGRRIHVVFSGTDRGNLEYVMAKASEMGLDQEAHYIGFVSSAEIPYLYKQAIALVMPTYFGPTNNPPLEAFQLGCPVLYSDLPGLRDQVKGAALLLNLSNPASLAENIIKVLTEPEEMKRLVFNGKQKIDNWTEQDYWLVLKSIFDDYAIKRKCWE